MKKILRLIIFIVVLLVSLAAAVIFMNTLSSLFIGK